MDSTWDIDTLKVEGAKTAREDWERWEPNTEHLKFGKALLQVEVINMEKYSKFPGLLHIREFKTACKRLRNAWRNLALNRSFATMFTHEEHVRFLTYAESLNTLLNDIYKKEEGLFEPVNVRLRTVRLRSVRRTWSFANT